VIVDADTLEVAVIEPDALHIPSSARQDMSHVVLGDFLVSTTGAGFIREVTSRSLSDDTIIFGTRRAALGDIITKGHVIDSWSFGPTGAKLATTAVPDPAAAGGEVLRVDLPETIIYEDPYVQMVLTNGYVDFAPVLSLDMELDNGGLEYFAAEFSTATVVNLEVDVRVLQGGSNIFAKETRLWESRPYFVSVPLGPIPLIMQVVFAVDADIAVNTDGGNTHFGMRLAAAPSTIVKFQEQAWSTEWNNFQIYGWPQEPTIDVPENLSVQAGVTPSVEIKFYGVVGPKFAARPSMTLTTDLRQQLWNLDAQLEANVSVELDGVIPGLPNFEKNLLSLEKSLGSGTY